MSEILTVNAIDGNVKIYDNMVEEHMQWMDWDIRAIFDE